MELSYAQKKDVYEKGFVVVPGVVPKLMIDRALREINHSLGEGLPKEQIIKMRAQSYCNELQGTQLFKDLINKTPAIDLVGSLLGTENVKPVGGAQIALRFPNLNEGPVKVGGGHIDGIYSPDNGVPKGEIHNFTMLAVVLLSDLPGPFCGNFTVWPGSHHKLEKYFRENGPETILNGMPKVDQGEPYQVIGKAGDVVFTHYQLIHTAAPNCSPHVRYATIYRINHASRKTHGETRAMTDMWFEWEGLREIVPARAAEPAKALAN